jgi:hypothetical protein
MFEPKTNTLVSSNVPAGDNQGYMFDEFVSTQTENADTIIVEIKFNNSDRIALFNMDAYSVDLELTDDYTSSVVQTKSIDLELSNGEYRQWIVETMYIYANATLKITINKAGSTAKCGVCVYGTSTYIGDSEWNLKAGFVDYSIKDTNEFGQTYLNAGNWSKTPDVRTHFLLGILDAIFEDLVDIRGTLAVFEINQGDTDYEALRIFGFLNDWNITLNNPTIGYIDFDIQGVI